MTNIPGSRFAHPEWKTPKKKRKRKKIRRVLSAEEKARRKERRAENATISAMQKRWMQKYASVPKNRLKLLFYQVQRRAETVEHEFDATIIEKFTSSPPTHCACCHKVLDYSTGRGHTDRDDSPSIDRVRNLYGYIPGNVAIVCWVCNRRKSDSSIPILKEIIAYMEAHQKKTQ